MEQIYDSVLLEGTLNSREQFSMSLRHRMGASLTITYNLMLYSEKNRS